jgi:hypothetical protein
MKTVTGVLLLGCLAAAPCPQEGTLPGRIDAGVRQISGFQAPAPVCGDGEFLRRVMLDLVGYPPNAEEVRTFLADPSPRKRQARVDQLLSTERHADFWARRWMDVFFGNYHVSRLEPLKSLDPEDAARLMESFRRWRRRARPSRSPRWPTNWGI